LEEEDDGGREKERIENVPWNGRTSSHLHIIGVFKHEIFYFVNSLFFPSKESTSSLDSHPKLN
jgi:hypothetical protein